jgi:hypothetical protein
LSASANRTDHHRLVPRRWQDNKTRKPAEGGCSSLSRDPTRDRFEHAPATAPELFDVELHCSAIGGTQISRSARQEMVSLFRPFDSDRLEIRTSAVRW